MSTLTIVQASEMEVGQVIYPRTKHFLDFRIKSIRKNTYRGIDFITFRGESICSRHHHFKCYSTSLVGFWDGDSTVEINNVTL